MRKTKSSAVVQRYVNLLTNGGFKAVFGDRKNKDVVMSVINMLLPESKRVRDIEYDPTEHQGQLDDSMKKHTHELQDDTIFIIFAELARFDRALEDCVNDLEKMLYVIKNGWRLKNQPPELQAEIFTRLLGACDIPRFSKKKRIQYEKDMHDERRYFDEIETAKEIGREEGLKTGLEEGEAKGREEGRMEGREEGREEERVFMARKMLAGGLPVEQIAEFTGLAPEQILALDSAASGC